MTTLRNFIRIVDAQTIVITVLAVVATWLCDRFDLEADMPTGIIGIAIIFPIVFSINAAYRRREEALRFLSSLKSHAASIYYAHRDWVPAAAEGREQLAMKALPRRLLERIRDHLSSSRRGDTAGLQAVYDVFSEYSAEHERVRALGVPTGEVCRCNQYLRSMMIDFENMNNIHQYRTPVALRAYSSLFLNAFPIIYAPYFAHLCVDTTPLVGYAVAVLYAVVLVSLDNIQEALEDPFDSFGDDADDIDLDIADSYTGML